MNYWPAFSPSDKRMANSEFGVPPSVGSFGRGRLKAELQTGQTRMSVLQIKVRLRFSQRFFQPINKPAHMHTVNQRMMHFH